MDMEKPIRTTTHVVSLNKEDIMHRAIVVFVDNKTNLIKEVKVLLASLENIHCLDTDLIVFGPHQALLKTPDNCIKSRCNCVGNRPNWKGYTYINSIACVNEAGGAILDNYTHILRCDADTLVTPAWNNFYPTNYTTGKGGYVNDDFTKEKLLSIANRLGLRHQGIFNTGSSHYGTTKQVKEVCALTTEIAEYIIKNEFLHDEGHWPSWFRGVISMYASDLAVNHLIQNPTLDGNSLDFRSDSIDSVSTHPHIHCWHTENWFSKFAFNRGDYNNISRATLDIDKISHYCMAMALKSMGK